MLLVSLILRIAFPFVLLLDWPRMIAAVQLDAMLVQYAKHRTSASETAGPPYFINGMTCNIQVDDSYFSVELLHLC